MVPLVNTLILQVSQAVMQGATGREHRADGRSGVDPKTGQGGSVRGASVCLGVQIAFLLTRDINVH